MEKNKFERLAMDVSEKLKFMENFDPERSNREKRKLTRKIYNSTTTSKKPSTLFNERGVHIATGKDLCDCLDEDCPGCFFPCARCKSFKCGHECRRDRKWMYDGYEVEGLDIKRINKVRNN